MSIFVDENCKVKGFESMVSNNVSLSFIDDYHVVPCLALGICLLTG